MKNLFTLLIFFFCAHNVFSQGIAIIDTNGNSVVGDTIFIDAIIDANDDFQEIKETGPVLVINQGSVSMDIGLIRYEEEIVDGTGDAVCWGQTCFGEQQNNPVWDVNDSAIVAAGDTAGGILGGFVTYHYPHIRAGNSTYRYRFYQRRGFAGADFYIQFRTSYVTDVSSVGLKSSDVTIYPIPANDVLNVKFSSNQAIVDQIEVKDLLGKVVIDNANINNEAINVSNLNPGVYFISFITNGQTTVTKKFIKK